MPRRPDVQRLRLRRGLAVVAFGAVAAARAAAPDGRCEPSVAGLALTEAMPAVEAYATLSEGCLKSMFLRCAEAADHGLLGPASAMACSVGYEALRRKVFGDDFDALLDWWRSTRAVR